MSARRRQGRRRPTTPTTNTERETMAKPKVEPVVETPAADDGLTAVRTTFNPHEVIRVGDAELLDLERQGLIYTEGDLGEPDDDEGTDVPSGVITDAPAAAGITDDSKGPGE